MDDLSDHVIVDEANALAALEMDDTLTVEAWIFPQRPFSSLGVIAAKEGEYWISRWPTGHIGFAIAKVDRRIKNHGLAAHTSPVAAPEVTMQQ